MWTGKFGTFTFSLSRIILYGHTSIHRGVTHCNFVKVSVVKVSVGLGRMGVFDTVHILLLLIVIRKIATRSFLFVFY